MSDEEKRDKEVRDYYKQMYKHEHRTLEQDVIERARLESERARLERLKQDNRRLAEELRMLQRELGLQSEDTRPPDQEYHDDDFKHFQENFHHYHAAAHPALQSPSPNHHNAATKVGTHVELRVTG